MKISLVILAAGNSTRFQANKLLYPYHGKALIEHVFQHIPKDCFDQVVVVTQYQQIEVLAKAYGFLIVYNTSLEKGISYSLQLGLKASLSSSGCMFLAGDQPWLTSESIEVLCKHFDGTHILCASSQGVMKNPILFPSMYYEELLSLKGDIGGKQVVLRHKDACMLWEINEKELIDVDRKENLEIS